MVDILEEIAREGTNAAAPNAAIKQLRRGGPDRRVSRTISCGEVTELVKTAAVARFRSRTRAGGARKTPTEVGLAGLFPAARGGRSDLDNFRRREWAPAMEAAGVPGRRGSTTCAPRSPRTRSRPACSVFELARDHGHVVAMIERHYGTLIEGAGADIARRLTAFEAQQQRATSESARSV